MTSQFNSPQIYQDDSAASFYHFYRMLECLLRCFPGDVYESICSDGQMAARMRRMMRYIGYAPVGESIAMLIALTPVSRMSQLYQLSSKNRWLFFEQLSQKHFMLSLVEIIVFPEEFCYTNGYINAEQHSACATFVLQELVEKLSVEETGELLLQPFGYTSKLLEHLIDTALTGYVISIRRSATKLLCFLLRRVADSDILYMVSAGGGAAPAPAYVPNRLFPLRDRIINQIFLRIKNFMQALLNSDDWDGEMDEGNFKSESPSGPIKYSSYSVKSPFTVLRAVFLELITLMVESDDTVAELISPELWTLLIKWTLRYAHNSIYHAIFYRLVYSVLRYWVMTPSLLFFPPLLQFLPSLLVLSSSLLFFYKFYNFTSLLFPLLVPVTYHSSVISSTPPSLHPSLPFLFPFSPSLPSLPFFFPFPLYCLSLPYSPSLSLSSFPPPSDKSKRHLK
jgi:hypothetical protein